MAYLPVNVTLVGENQTNPALPRRNIQGRLSIEHNNLIFKGGNFVHQIPLEHADKIYVYEEKESWGDEWHWLLGFFVSGAIILGTAGLGFIPYIWFFWWEYSPVTVHIVVKAWDEDYGVTATTMFRLGKKRKYREEASYMIQEMWRIRGDNRGDDRRGGQLIYRS